MSYNQGFFISDDEVSVVSSEEIEKNHVSYGIYGNIIPFNEAMCIGNPLAEFSTPQFIEERICALNTSYLIYKVKVTSKVFSIPNDRDVNFIFGYDMFSSINLLSLLGNLDFRGYKNKLIIYIFDLDTMKEKYNYELTADGFYNLYLENIVNKNKRLTPIESINNSLDKYFLYKKHDKNTLLSMLNSYEDAISSLKKHKEYNLPVSEWQKWLDDIR